MSHDYPDVGEAIAIHDTLIDELDGSPWHASRGGAGFSPQAAPARVLRFPDRRGWRTYGEPGQQSPFRDGDKRTALAVTDIFLRLNDNFIDRDSRDTYEFFMRLFELYSFRFDQLRPWLEENIRPLTA